MKQLTCEMCGGTDFIKQDGVFVCQNCGMKYSLDEARKMMNEGTVDGSSGTTIDVSGSTIKVDVSEELANLYLLARRAKDDNNCENATKYYDMILVKEPNNWEAAFYTVYFKAEGCKIAQIQSAAISVSNCVDTVLKLIKDHVSDKQEQIKAVQEIANRCSSISDMLYNAALKHYIGIDSQIKTQYTQEMLNNCCAARDIMYTLGNYTDSIFANYSELHTTVVDAWKNGITKHNGLMSFFAQKDTNKNIIMEYVAKVQKYDSSYQAPEIKTSSGGCYVATAVYGSYDCPEVWVLRRYRDYTLAETWYGRAFIKTYYAISPTLVKWFGHTGWFKKLWKGKLDLMVSRLQESGIESTPYEDRNW